MTSDREWEDFLMGNPNSPYPRMQMINDAKRASSGGGSGGGGRSVGRGGGGGSSGGLGELIVGLVLVAASPLLLLLWLTGRAHNGFRPFRSTDALGQWIARPSRKVTFVCAVLGAVLGFLALAMAREPLLARLTEEPRVWVASYGSYAALALGAAFGMFIPAIVGGLVLLTTRSIAFAFVVPCAAAVLCIVYVLLATAFGWTPLQELLPLQEWFPADEVTTTAVPPG